MSRAIASKTYKGRKVLADITNVIANSIPEEIEDEESEEESSGDEDDGEDDENVSKKKKKTTSKVDLPDFNQFRANPKPKLKRKRKFDGGPPLFDHHTPPEGCHFVRNPYPTIFQRENYIILKVATPRFRYSTEQIQNQIDEWHAKDVRFVINSLKLDKRKGTTPGVHIYKKTGITAGQLVSLCIQEIELIMKLLANQIFPDVFEFGPKGNKIPECDFVQESVSFYYSPFNWKDEGIPEDNFWHAPRKPAVREVINKIRIQQNTLLLSTIAFPDDHR
jgi:hypothetical protein